MTSSPSFREAAFAHYLPHWWVGDRTLVMHDGAMALGFKLQGPDPSCEPDDSVNAFVTQIRATLNSLPVGCHLQLMRRVREVDDEAYIELEQSLKSREPLLREQRAHAVRRLRHLRLRQTESYLFLSNSRALGRLGAHVSFPLGKLLDRVLGSRDPYAVTREQHLTALHTLEQQGDSLVRNLAGAGIKLSRLADEDLVTVSDAVLNPEPKAQRLRIFDDDPSPRTAIPMSILRFVSLREQLARSAVHWDLDSLALGDPLRLHRVMGMKSLPPRTFASMMHLANLLKSYGKPVVEL